MFAENKIFEQLATNLGCNKTKQTEQKYNLIRNLPAKFHQGGSQHQPSFRIRIQRKQCA